jgi:hypothetical protein
MAHVRKNHIYEIKSEFCAQRGVPEFVLCKDEGDFWKIEGVLCDRFGNPVNDFNESKTYFDCGTLKTSSSKKLGQVTAAEKRHKLISLICSCCGKYTKGLQWHNRDRGYGLCQPCAEDMLKKGDSAEEIYQNYGVRFPEKVT